MVEVGLARARSESASGLQQIDATQGQIHRLVAVIGNQRERPQLIIRQAFVPDEIPHIDNIRFEQLVQRIAGIVIEHEGEMMQCFCAVKE